MNDVQNLLTAEDVRKDKINNSNKEQKTDASEEIGFSDKQKEEIDKIINDVIKRHNQELLNMRGDIIRDIINFIARQINTKIYP